MSLRKLRVGVIGAGHVAQVVHLPTLQLLSHLYTTLAICDVSLKTADHCATKFGIPISTTDPQKLFENEEIDLLFVLTSDEFHAPYAIAALEAGKSVMVEKPITLSLKSCKSILQAEETAPNEARVFVGYMRRYAPSLEAFRREIASIDSIKYARVRDIIGPNSYFIGQSGCHPIKFVDDVSSHGLGVMREVLGGLPEKVIASTDNARWYTTMFDYRNRKIPHESFTCLYELGIDSVPRFDSEVTIYGEHKSVSIHYDTPFIKGLGIRVEVDEMNEYGDKVHRSIQTSYEDAYTAELKELHACVSEGKSIRTTATDAMEDLKLFDMMLKKHPL